MALMALMALRSLRSRLLVGSILWTIGLVLAAHVAAVHLVHWYFDGAPQIVMTRATFRLTGLLLVTLALLMMAAGFRQVRRGGPEMIVLSKCGGTRMCRGDRRVGPKRHLPGLRLTLARTACTG